MATNTQSYPIRRQIDNSAMHFTDGGEKEDMSKEDRKRQVLQLLAETRAALPRTVLFRNLSYRGANFSDSSLKNYLTELRDEGLVERIDAEGFANGSVKVSEDDPGYWIVTKEGYAEVEAKGSDDIDTSHL